MPDLEQEDFDIETYMKTCARELNRILTATGGAPRRAVAAARGTGT